MSKIAFVTGGTGFIGSHLVESLLQRGYTEVRCLVRKDLKWLKGLDITPVRGDFSDVDVLLDGLRDVDYVYHVAGLTRATTWDAFLHANVRGTLNLLGAVRIAAPALKKVLVTSSLAAVGRCDQPIATEDVPLRPLSLYGRSKAEMEEALRRMNQDETRFLDLVPLVVVRPPAVYGPREADIYTVFQTASRGLFPILGDGRNPDLSLVHSTDLVRGMIDAAESENTTGKTYFIGSDEQYAWNTIRDVIMKELGRRALTVHIPPALVGPIGTLAELGGRLTGTYPPLNREKANEIRYACKMCSSEMARRDFGYRQLVSLEDGIAETVDWYRKNDWL